MIKILTHINLMNKLGACDSITNIKY